MLTDSVLTDSVLTDSVLADSVLVGSTIFVRLQLTSRQIEANISVGDVVRGVVIRNRMAI